MSVAANLEKLFSLEGKVVLLTGATGGSARCLQRVWPRQVPVWPCAISIWKR